MRINLYLSGTTKQRQWINILMIFQILCTKYTTTETYIANLGLTIYLKHLIQRLVWGYVILVFIMLCNLEKKHILWYTLKSIGFFTQKTSFENSDHGCRR